MKLSVFAMVAIMGLSTLSFASQAEQTPAGPHLITMGSAVLMPHLIWQR